VIVPKFEIEALVQVACIWEVSARKVGNVHPTASFVNTAFTDFLLSAVAINMAFADDCGRGVGLAVWRAVEDTIEYVGQNTNIGICLLAAPMAAVSKSYPLSRVTLQRVLHELTREDAECVYNAIRLANPGGLGDAPEQDVRSKPTVTLLEAMKLAADRDMVARQYANGFADVFDFGVPAFLAGFERFGCIEAAIIDSQLRWLAEYPDSLIARKNGPAVAADAQRRAAEVLRLGGIATPEGRRAGVALDKHLRSDGNKLNPGTTADLITACLFVALRENKVIPAAPFRWQVSDWL
jgi:triphosphoribosyl-dephospho-CoA synthase